MGKICAFFMYAAIAVTLAGCSGLNSLNMGGPATVNPNYTSADPDLMRIGGEAPSEKEPEILNLGSYCLRVTEKWKADGKTPDGQILWTRDTFRKVTPCR